MKLAFTLLCVTACAAQIRINAGGPDVTDAGVLWQADKYYSTPSWYPPPETIPYGVSPIYATKRYGSSFTYAIPVPDGQYSVALYLIDTTSSGPGQRQFSVTINGAAALTDYDLAGDVGPNVPTKKSFTTTAVNGTGIKLQFTTRMKSALVNAIEILPLPPAPSGGLPPGITWDGTTLKISGKVSAIEYDGPPGEIFMVTGSHVSAAAVPTPPAGSSTLFFDADAGGRLARKDSTGAVFMIEPGPPPIAKLEKCVAPPTCAGLWRATAVLPDGTVLPLYGVPLPVVPPGAVWAVP